MQKLTLTLALSACLLASPAQASNYPTEVAIGPTLGLAGPGVAWRQYVLPWLGFQMGANTWGIAHFAGGALLVSPYHDDRRQRMYLSAGMAINLKNLTQPYGDQKFYPAVGFGASHVIHDRWTFFADMSVFPLEFTFWRSTSEIPFLAPQIGFMYTF